MKLRIRGNSLRLRLTRGELDTLRHSGRVAQSIAFPDGRALTYAIRAEQGTQALSVDFSGQEICVVMTDAQLQRWLQPQEVGVSGTLSLPDGGTLAVLLEKDFPCLTPRAGEEDTDAFDRPADDPPHCAPD